LWWKQYAVDLVPALSIAVCGTLVFMRVNIERYWRVKKSETFYRIAKQTSQDSLDNPMTSPSHKQDMTNKLEKLEKIHSDNALTRYLAD
jgi:hypothetical protein